MALIASRYVDVVNSPTTNAKIMPAMLPPAQLVNGAPCQIIGWLAPPISRSRNHRPINNGPRRVPVTRRAHILHPSGFLIAITSGRHKHHTGSAHIIVTRKIGRTSTAFADPVAANPRLRKTLKQATAVSRERSQRPMRLPELSGLYPAVGTLHPPFPEPRR
jgi:hypothetical protein